MELIEVSVYGYNYQTLNLFINERGIENICIFLQFHKFCLYDKIFVNKLFLYGTNLFITLNKQLLNLFNIKKDKNILNVNSCFSFDDFHIKKKIVKNYNIYDLSSGILLYKMKHAETELFNTQLHQYNLFDKYSESDMNNICNNTSKCCPIFYKKKINTFSLFVCNIIVIDTHIYEGYTFAMKLFYNCGFNLWEKMLEYNTDIISIYNIPSEIISLYGVVH